MNAGRRIVVTGAGGFVGGYLARWFAARGHMVVATMRRSRPLTPFPAGISVLAGDLRDRSLLPTRFDALIHCAAETPARCADPDRLFADNVEAARAVFERARAAGARATVFMSSMSIYGRIAVPVVAEDLAPVEPDAYGLSKTEGEHLLDATVNAGLASGLSIRLPGTVGRGSHDNFLSDALARARHGETLRGRHPEALFNNIVFVGDLARFLEAWVGAPCAGHVVTNIAAGDPISIAELYSRMFACLGLPERIRYESTGKPPFLISIDRAVALGYEAPSVSTSIAAFVRDSINSEADPATVAGRATVVVGRQG